MSARYYTKVADELMEQIRRPGILPKGLRLIAELHPIDDGNQRWTLVEFEDDGAPEWMAGKVVSPVISREAGRQTEYGAAGRSGPMAEVNEATTDELVKELTRRKLLPRCPCGRWQTYTLRCYGCLRAIGACRCG